MDATLINVLIGIGGLIVLGLIEKRKQPAPAQVTKQTKRRKPNGTVRPKPTPEQLARRRTMQRIREIESKGDNAIPAERFELYNLYGELDRLALQS